MNTPSPDLPPSPTPWIVVLDKAQDFVQDLSTTVEAYVGPDTGWVPCPMVAGHAAFALHAGLPKRMDLLARPDLRALVADWLDRQSWMGTALVSSSLRMPPIIVAQILAHQLRAKHGTASAIRAVAVRNGGEEHRWIQDIGVPGREAVVGSLYRPRLADATWKVTVYADPERPRYQREAPTAEEGARLLETLLRDRGFALLHEDRLLLPAPLSSSTSPEQRSSSTIWIVDNDGTCSSLYDPKEDRVYARLYRTRNSWDLFLGNGADAEWTGQMHRVIRKGDDTQCKQQLQLLLASSSIYTLPFLPELL